MKITILSLLLLLLNSFSFGQDTTIAEQKFAFSDTTLLRIDIKDTFKPTDKIAVIGFGREAVIYINENNIRKFVSKNINIDYEAAKKSYRAILSVLNNDKRQDTIFLNQYDFFLEGIVSEEMRSGHVKIFDIKNKAFVPFVYNRMERVISDGYRTFYFSDHRCFFQFHELSGVIPNEMFPDSE